MEIHAQNIKNVVLTFSRQFRFALIASTLLFTAIPTSVFAQTYDGSNSNRDSVALLIGCDEYDSIVGLKYCDADVRSLKCAFQKLGFQARNIAFLFSKSDAYSGRPTRANILDALDKELTSDREGETLIVVFCGHGVFFEGKSRLCPQDASTDHIVQTTIAVDDVLAKMARTSFKKKLLIVDACRDAPEGIRSIGGSLRGTTSKTSRARAFSDSTSFLRGISLEKFDSDNLALLSSCSEGEQSHETPRFSHGVFTYFLLEALLGEGGVSSSGAITLYSVVDYVTEEISKYCEEVGWRQTPKLRTVGEVGAFTLGKISKRVPVFENSLGTKFSVLPGGNFEAGSQESPEALKRAFAYYYDDVKSEWFEDEYPAQEKTVAPFAIARCETTVAEFRRFVEETGYVTDAEKKKGGFGVEKNGSIKRSPQYTWKNPHYLIDGEVYPQEENFPVVNVSWNDAVAYCKWLSDKTGDVYRLPTQYEWEYAARAGTTSRYWFGNDPEELTKYDNVADESARKYFPNWDKCLRGDDRYPFAAPVDATTPNPWGIYGTCGNVCEWCLDENEKEPARKNVRGGSWYNWPNIARASNKHSGRPDDQACFIGFRVVLDASSDSFRNDDER